MVTDTRAATEPQEIAFGEDGLPTREGWREIARRLQEPFDPSDVDFRVQGKANEQTGRAQVVAYIDARAVQERLDAVIGAGCWSFDWQPLVIDKGEVMVAKGIVTIHGVSKSDAGSASNFEQSLGAVSHCFKRAAVHWGIGRYLYNLPMNWVSVERGGRIPEPVLRELRSRLPRPDGSAGATDPTADTDRADRQERRTDEAVRPHAQPRPQPQPAPESADDGAPAVADDDRLDLQQLKEWAQALHIDMPTWGKKFNEYAKGHTPAERDTLLQQWLIGIEKQQRERKQAQPAQASA